MLDPIFKKDTARVKSCCFHPSKPIFLTAHHDGTIQIYNYLLKTRVAILTDHLGPVRTIVFHPFLEIFASGGDDTKIKIWCFRTKKVLTTFSDHKDYIRSLDFHPTLPYLLSSSDDQTVKIYNFQSKKLLSTLIGHTHYVMGVKFFGSNFIVSVSLDQSIRIWDYRRINEKKKGILGLPNVSVKQIIEGHEKGINGLYVYKNMFVTASDDREVKLWEENNELVSLKETFYHHTNIVSSAIISDASLISNGEDGIFCKFDFSKRTTEKYTIDNRFWCVAEKENLVLTGHDNGFIMFSLKKVQPVFTYEKGELYYVKENGLFFSDFTKENKIHSFTKTTPLGIKLVPKRFLYSDDIKIIFQYENHFEISNTKIKERGKALIYDDLLVIKKSNKVNFMNNKLQIYKTVENDLDDLFYLKDGLFLGCKGTILYLLNDDLEIIKQKSILKFNELISNKNTFCIYNENELAVLNYELDVISIVKEILPINNAIFYKEALIYATKTQVKYLFKESGLLKSIENAFLLEIRNNFIFYLKDDIINKSEIQMHELNFTISLVENNEEKIKSIIEKGELLGLSPVDKLIKYNKGELALEFITDLSYKFKLALSAKKYEDCLEYCTKLNEKEYYTQLCNVSIQECEVEVAEKCLVYLKEYKRLLMLLVCSKNVDKINNYIDLFDPNTKILALLILNDKDAFLSNFFGKNVSCDELIE